MCGDFPSRWCLLLGFTDTIDLISIQLPQILVTPISTLNILTQVAAVVSAACSSHTVYIVDTIFWGTFCRHCEDHKRTSSSLHILGIGPSRWTVCPLAMLIHPDRLKLLAPLSSQSVSHAILVGVACGSCIHLTRTASDNPKHPHHTV